MAVPEAGVLEITTPRHGGKVSQIFVNGKEVNLENARGFTLRVMVDDLVTYEIEYVAARKGEKDLRRA